MMKFAIPILYISFLIFISSCASIIRGSKENIAINSEPNKAEIVVTLKEANVKVPADSSMSVTYTDRGVIKSGVVRYRMTHEKFFTGRTPASVKLSRKNEYRVTVSKVGYLSETIEINKGNTGWIVGSFLTGGIIGWIVDRNSGAMYSLNPKDIHVILTPLR